jgi:hypothetical protein
VRHVHLKEIAHARIRRKKNFTKKKLGGKETQGIKMETKIIIIIYIERQRIRWPD